MDVFLNLPTTQEAIQNHELPIAISCEEAEIIPINPSTLKNIIVLSESKQSLQYTICHLISVINHCLSNGHVLLVDSNEEYSFLREKANAYISGEEILELFSNLDKEITNRKETPKDVQTFIVIPDLLKKFLYLKMTFINCILMLINTACTLLLRVQNQYSLR